MFLENKWWNSFLPLVSLRCDYVQNKTLIHIRNIGLGNWWFCFLRKTIFTGFIYNLYNYLWKAVSSGYGTARGVKRWLLLLFCSPCKLTTIFFSNTSRAPSKQHSLGTNRQMDLARLSGVNQWWHMGTQRPFLFLNLSEVSEMIFSLIYKPA